MVKVNSDTCIGCGACVAIAPDTFEFDENGLSRVIDGAVPSEAATEAIGSCPVGAIEETVENAEGGEGKVIEFPKQPAVEEVEEESDMAA